MKVFVTGIEGFIGRHLASELVAGGHQVAGSFLAGAPPALPGVVVELCDILDRAALSRLLERFAPDALVHLAGLSHVGASWQQVAEYHQANVVGTLRVLEAAPPETRLVLASSAEVYGRVNEREQPIGEGMELRPRTPSAMSKAAAELLLRDRAIVVRMFTVVGAGQSPRFALPGFAEQLAEIARGLKPPVVRVGNLESRRDFVDVRDCVAAYRLLIERGVPGEAYNVATGRAVSIAQALQLLIEIAGVAVQVSTEAERVRTVDVPLVAGDANKLRRLGWRPRYRLEDALDTLWREAITRASAP